MARNIRPVSSHNGHVYFSVPPTVVRGPVRLTWGSVEPVLRYLASGPFLADLGDRIRDPDWWAKACDVMAERVSSRIAQDSAFVVHSETGVFLVRKPG